MKPLISVVVPVYGTEAYLPRCVDSLLAQTYKNLEIILVNDGSPDMCGDICDSYASKNSHVKVIHQKNAGVSQARNRGIEASSGEYIGFIDSDDFIAPDMYEYLYDICRKHRVDVVQCARKTVFDSLSPVLDENDTSVEVLKGTEAIKELMCSRKIKSSTCDKLYHRSLFMDIRFDSTLCTGEDFFINTQLIRKAESIAVTDKCCYYYFYRPSSASKGKIDERQFEVFERLSEKEQWEKQKNMVPYWKLRKAMFAVNFLRRMIPAGDYSRFWELRQYMTDVKFVLINLNRYRVSNERLFALHVLLIWLIPWIYIRCLNRRK